MKNENLTPHITARRNHFDKSKISGGGETNNKHKTVLTAKGARRAARRRKTFGRKA